VAWFPVSLLYAIEAAAIALMMLFVAAEFVRQAQVLRGVGAER
jgi:hypothetical protein